MDLITEAAATEGCLHWEREHQLSKSQSGGRPLCLPQ